MKPTTHKHTLFFFIPYFLYVTALIVGMTAYSKAELHLLMNDCHTPFGDWFFPIFTQVGGGTTAFLLLALLLFYRYSYTVYLLSAQLAGGIVSFTLKRIFNEPRPLPYFQEYYPHIDLPLVEGVKMHWVHSFPSGHTITAFALFFGLALICKNKWLSFFFFVAAAVTGYSRVYLSQHFAVDILFGSVIGILIAWVCYPLLAKLEIKWEKKSLIKRK